MSGTGWRISTGNHRRSIVERDRLIIWPCSLSTLQLVGLLVVLRALSLPIHEKPLFSSTSVKGCAVGLSCGPPRPISVGSVWRPSVNAGCP